MMLKMLWKTSTTQKSMDGQSDWSTAKILLAETGVEETRVRLTAVFDVIAN